MKCKLQSVISHADLKDVNSWSGVGGALSHCGVEAKRGCQLAGLVPVCVPARRHYLTQYRTGRKRSGGIRLCDARCRRQQEVQ